MNKDNLLTIMTPTYNRAKMLPSLYESLCNQTSNNFIWLIVDDGSIDNTKEVVNSFLKDQKIQIEYYYEVNAGKYVAHNKGVEVCSTELFVCVDSDDILLPQAVEKIENTWKSVKDNYVGGIVSPKEMDGYSYFNNPPKTCKLMDLYNSKYLVGETVLVYKSSLLKEHLFPVIPGEKFMSESVLYNILDQKCKLLSINYYVDLNVVTTTNTYLFESLDLENASQFILKLNETIKVIDAMNLIDLFKTKSINELKEYMDQHYKDWAKKYNLENPRTTLDENMVRLAHNKH